MKKCETCKHWKKTETIMGVHWGSCSSLTHGAEGMKSKVNFAVDAYDIQSVNTTADFGCALWEKKE